MHEPKKRILISGASGLIGSALRRAAQERGLDITTLVRRHRQVTGGTLYWNPEKPGGGALHPMGLESCDAIVHLSGANVARRWTQEYRREIVASRVESTRVLCHALAQVRNPPRVLICASAIGIYGDRGDQELTEASAPGTGFLAETCTAWEQAADPARAAGIRVVHARFGVVLSRNGGALRKMLPAFRLGLGGRMGSGHQWMSWISLRDAVRALFFLMDQELSAAFNLTAPQPVTNSVFTQTLAASLHRPALLNMPAGVLHTIFGADMANQTVLSSIRVLPQRLADAGFAFEDPELGAALRALLR